MTLSVCCATADPPARVARVLAPVRDLADEIVVAYDARVDPATLGPVAAIADRLVRFEFRDYVEQALAWLHGMCSGDWILRLDGDEVVSPRMLDVLAGLERERDVDQFWFGYRWLYPDPGHWLAEPPWSFDTNRLVRNDPATMWFPGLCHTVAEPVFPAAYPDAPLYHLSWLVSSPQALQAKVEHYLVMPSGHAPEVIEQDVPAFYRPDVAAHGAPAPVPPEDLPLILDVLAAPLEADTLDPVPHDVPLVPWAEVERHWAHRPLAQTAYRARVVPLVDALALQPGEPRAVPVQVVNEGGETWPGGAQRAPLVRLGHRWGDGFEGPRTMLPGPLGPGEAVVVDALVEAPPRPGAHALRFDLVHESTRWFGCEGRALPVVVSR
jgi:hypothetical protein